LLIDSRAFDGDLQTMRAKRLEAPGTPVLYLVAEDELMLLLPSITEPDDVCLHGASPELIAHRLTRILVGGDPRLPRRDPLTGLLARSELLAQIELRCARADPRRPLSLIIFDLDLFKQLNDEYGHTVGDLVLREWAIRLRAHAPEQAIASRYGGEEMALLFWASEAEALAQAELISEAVRSQPFTDEHIRVSVSAGLTTTEEIVAPNELVGEADQAVYAAKAAGRDRCVHYAELEREALREDEDIDVFTFENMTRVISERIASMIARRGRRIFRDLKRQADVDSLTGLYSRRYLDRRLAFEFSEARRLDAPLTVAMIDVDHFGKVNKNHGWPSGDLVLKRMAEVVQQNIRTSDWVARYGGEELCLVMAGTPLDQAASVLERLRIAVESTPFVTEEDVTLHVTISIGAAENGELPNIADLAKVCSDRLLEAKRAGRNQVKF